MGPNHLRAAVLAFTEQAGPVLASATAAGDEVGFELVEERGRSRSLPMYCYRSLIGDFVDRHAAELARLETYLPALHALASAVGLPAYLQARGVAHPPAGERPCADLALRLLLAQAYEDAEPNFEHSPERFEQAWTTFQRAALDGQLQTVVVALLRGLVVRSPEVHLGDGVTLMQPDAFDALPPQSGWPDVGDGPIPSTLVVLSAGEDSGSAPARVRSLLTALRLFGAGIAVEPLAWMRADAAAWRAVALDVRGRARGAIVIAPEQEDELRAFCSLIARRAARGGTLTWALDRFERGCEAHDPLVALSDHLLALRALLEPEGPRSGRLAGRLAALCALPPDRAAHAERVAHAISLERTAIAGLAPHDRDVERLVAELAEDLRALLRDVLCGHLANDLVGLADELIGGAAADAPGETPAPAPAPAQRFEHEPAVDLEDDYAADLESLAGEWPAADQLGQQPFV